MKNKTWIKRLFGLMLATLFVATSLATCAPLEPDGLLIDLTVARQALNPQGMPNEPGSPPTDIDTFRLCVLKAEGELVKCRTFDELEADRSYSLGDIPAGTRRIVTFQGYMAADEAVRWCGRATEVEIKHQGTTRVEMMLSRCSDFTTTVGDPTVARIFHSGTLLPDGRVLIAGGFDAHAEGTRCDLACRELQATNTVEIYDPTSGTFEQLNTGLTHPRGLHQAAVLQDGRVLLMGGCEVASLQSDFVDSDQPGSPLRCVVPGLAASTIEIYNPASQSTQVVDIDPTVFAGMMPAADDQFLLVGGENADGEPINRALLITVGGSRVDIVKIENPMEQARRAPMVVAFTSPDAEPAEGLLIGGRLSQDWFDPGDYAERLVFQAGNLLSTVPRFVREVVGEGLPVMHACGVRINPGRVLITGGIYPGRFNSLDEPFLPKPLAVTAVADLRLESLTVFGENDILADGRVFHSCTVVDNAGHALVAGGFSLEDPAAPLRYQAIRDAEWWDDEAETFSLRWRDNQPARMDAPRAGHSATLLQDGTVLLTGGSDGTDLLLSAELFNPSSTALDQVH
ncbi:MAG: hypothetical protein JRF33_00985 [Deltaproteobacteria bacterium]|nr:hypothetical protein [Deltaproteobacteria bacterium]